MEINKTFITIIVVSAYLIIIDCYESYIIKGESEDIINFPYMVSLQERSRENEHFCGGAIVSTCGIVTIASCVIGKAPSNVRVLAGSSDLLTENDFKKYEREYYLEKINIHKYYNFRGNLENNIAYLKTKGNIEYSQFIRPAYLPDQKYFGSLDLLPTKVTVTGYGPNVS